MEPDQPPTGSQLIKSLFSRRWARPALSVLAAGPRRQRDLIVALVAASGSVVHSRSLRHAMTYLEENHLVVRHDDRPGLVTYEITDLGRRIDSQAGSLESAVQRERHLDRSTGVHPIGNDEATEPEQ